MVSLEVLNPVAAMSQQPDVKAASRLSDLSGKTIGLYWNNKPSGDVLNQLTAELLTDKFDGVRFKKYLGSKGATIHRASAEDVDMMAKECDAVIGSLAD